MVKRFSLVAFVALSLALQPVYASKLFAGQNEDTAHASGDRGGMVLGVRNDDLATLGGTDGDYSPFQFDASGALYVNPATDGTPAVYYNASLTATGTTDAGANRIRFVNYCNTDATDEHTLKIYDKATAATQADTPVFKVEADADRCAQATIPGGIPITNGISLRATAEFADSGTTAASANESAVTLLLDD